MTEPTLATSLDETPVFFTSGEETLFGVATRPTTTPNGVGVILIYGGFHKLSAMEGEIWTRIARQAAASGFHVLRYDHRGNGDSTGSTSTFDHRYPFSDDLLSAIRWMESQGIHRYALVGQCLGARAALVSAQSVPGVEMMCLSSAVVYDARLGKDEDWAGSYDMGHYLKRVFKWRTIRRLANADLRRAYFRVGMAKIRQILSRGGKEPPATASGQVKVSASFLDPLADALERGVKVDFVFGSTDVERRSEFEMARQGRLGELMDEAGELVEVNFVEGGLAEYMDLRSQDELIDHVTQWLTAAVDDESSIRRADISSDR